MAEAVKVAGLDLPREVLSVLRAQGLETLYPPQAESIGPALAGRSLVLAQPTASGKSLVAYLAIVKSVLEGGRALYIVPLRALAAEKLEDLKAFEPAGLRVGISTGELDSPGEALERYDVVVATSEKADSLLRHRTRWLEELTVVVADEVHMMGDPERGPTLEVLLTRFRKLNPRAQLLALSATIANSAEIARWAGAEHFSSTWRPVKLREGVLHDGEITFSDNTRREVGGDPEPSFPLVRQVLAGGGQCLVFLSSRRATESYARKAGPLVRELLAGADREAPVSAAGELDAAEGERTPLGDRLRDCLVQGAAFHHAGLTLEQRRAVERGFRAGKLKLLAATPTLAAGLNLPARCVIIRDIRRFEPGAGQVFLPVLEVKQMAGRAGRPKYDREGEAVIVAKTEPEFRIIFDQYILGEPEPIESKLGMERALRVHALSSVATGFSATERELKDFFNGTFHAFQVGEREVGELVDRALDFLVEEGFVERDGERLVATPIGRRVSELYIDPLTAKTIKDALSRAGAGHPPIAYLAVASATPDLRKVGMYLRRGDIPRLEERAGLVRETLILEPPEEPAEYEWFLADLKLACLLEDWIDEMSEEEITVRYDVGPGDIRVKVEAAQWVLHAMREISRLLRIGPAGEIDAVQKRVEGGMREELLELFSLRGIGRVRARSLFNAGFRSLPDLARAGREELARVPKIGPSVADDILGQLDGSGEGHGGPGAGGPGRPRDDRAGRQGRGDEGGRRRGRPAGKGRKGADEAGEPEDGRGTKSYFDD